MEKTDARKLKPDVQQQLRNQAIGLRKAGKKYREIEEVLGISQTTICTWYKNYERKGSKGIKIKKRGRKLGSHRSLNVEQELQLQKMIQDKCPDQLKLPFSLWTRKAVQQLIKQLWDYQMPIRTVGEYLKRWGFTVQKPMKKAYEQNPKAVKKWLDEQYPVILARAREEKAQIQWGNETGLCNDAYHGRSYAPRGKTPVIRLPAKHGPINLISTVTNQGMVRFMIYRGPMNAQRFIKFLGRLIKNAKQKIFLILDKFRVHHAIKVKEWLEGKEEKIELFFLPSYSPELNPDEYLNCDLKAGVHSGVPARTKSQLSKKALSHLRMLEKTPGRVKKYFKHPKIAYAA